MTDPQREAEPRPSEPDRFGPRDVDASPEAAEADEQVHLSRVGAWLLVAVIVLAGIALYFSYHRRSVPLLG